MVRLDDDDDDRGTSPELPLGLDDLTVTIAAAAERYDKRRGSGRPRVPPNGFDLARLRDLQQCLRMERRGGPRAGLAKLEYEVRRRIFCREQQLAVEQATGRSSTTPQPGAPPRAIGLAAMPTDRIRYDVQSKKQITAEFFSELFAETHKAKLPRWVHNVWQEDHALKEFRSLDALWLREGLMGMSKNTTCAEGRIVAEMLTALDEDTLSAVGLLCKARVLGVAPIATDTVWDTHIVCLQVKKKRDNTFLVNYRPIVVLPVLYKWYSPGLALLAGDKLLADIPEQLRSSMRSARAARHTKSSSPSDRSSRSRASGRASLRCASSTPTLRRRTYDYISHDSLLKTMK